MPIDREKALAHPFPSGEGGTGAARSKERDALILSNAAIEVREG